MGYAIYQMNGRDCGYGVPAICEHPGCNENIDRGMGYCCGSAPDSEQGCHMYFCGKHLFYVSRINEDGEEEHSTQLCEICSLNFKLGDDNYKLHAALFPEKPDTEEWCHWKLEHESWQEWRDNNPEDVKKLRKVVAAAGKHQHDWDEIDD